MHIDWREKQVILESWRVRFEPLQTVHFPELLKVKHDIVFEQDEAMDFDQEVAFIELTDLLKGRRHGSGYPFAIIDKFTGDVIGTTAINNVPGCALQLELGKMIVSPGCSEGLSLDCRFLMLVYCFETLGVTRIEFQVFSNDKQERLLVQQLGARLEGYSKVAQRQQSAASNYLLKYSIVESEWERIKSSVSKQLEFERINEPEKAFKVVNPFSRN